MKISDVFVSVLLLIGVAACDPVPEGAYYQPSEETFDFDFKKENSFGKYVTQNIAYLEKHRVYYDHNETETELSRIVPYELPIPSNCKAESSKGALLIHGILDTTYALRDIAEFLNAECLLVRGLLLPGHGTRPGDLLQITKEEWIEAVDFGIRSLKKDVDQVHVVGFSLGGLLATHAATNHPDLSGLILISPSLQITYSALVWQTQWLRHFQDWIDVDPNTNPVRYHSTPFNALAELVELKSKTIRSLRRTKGLKPAVFAMLTADDISINPKKTLELLQKASSNEKSRFIYYGPASKEADDARTDYRSSYLPELRILNFSHVAFNYSPDNPLFGENGMLKECGQNIRVVSEEETAQCFEMAAPWKGELGSTKEQQYLPIQRLTYNPDFNRMKEEMLSFIDETGGFSLADNLP